MAKLFLKGISKPFTIEKGTAININRMIEDSNIHTTQSFNKNGIRFTKADIRYIVEDDYEDDSQARSDTRKNENDNYYSNVITEFNAHVRILCNRRIEEKVNDTKLYELVYLAFTGNMEAPEEFINQVKERQRIYFAEHPNYPYAMINLKDLLPRQKASHKDGVVSIAEIMPSFWLRKTEGIIGEAMSAARYMKLI